VRKLRLAFLLPIAQVVVAYVLMERSGDVPACWPICRGLNAPALVLSSLNPNGLGLSWQWLPESFDLGRVLFLFGVAIVWFLVGLTIDRRGMPSMLQRTHLAIAVTLDALLLALGGLLLFGAVHDFDHSANASVLLGWFLMLLWSLALIFISIRAFIKTVRRGAARRA
jgi:hypothetical protein